MIDRGLREKDNSVRRRLMVALVCTVIYVSSEIWFHRNKLLNPPDSRYIIVFTILTLFSVAVLLFCAMNPRWAGSSTNLDDPAQLNKLRLRSGFTFGLLMAANYVLGDYGRSDAFVGIIFDIAAAATAGMFFAWWTGNRAVAKQRDRKGKDWATQDRSD